MDGQKKNISAKGSYFQPQRILLNILFLIGLIIIIIINIISFRQLQNFTLASQWGFHTYKVIEASNQILLNHLNSVALTRGYLLTGDETFLINLDQILNDMNFNLKLVNNLTVDNLSQQKRIVTLAPLLQQRTDLLKKSIQLKKAQKLTPSEARNLIYLGQTLTDKIESIVAGIYYNELSLLQQRNATIEKNFKSTFRFVLLMNAISILLLVAFIILFNRRFTENLISSEKIHRSEILLKGIINGTNDYIAAIDLNFNYVAFNHTFEEEFKRIFGKKPVVGMSVKDSLELVPTDIEIIMPLWNRALKGEEFTIIGQFGNKSLAQDEYEVTFNSIYDDNRKLIGASHIARNVAKRIEQERSLKMAKEDIENSYKELKKHDSEISMINEMNGDLQSASSFEETIAIIRNYCIKLLPFSKGALYIINPSRNYLEPITTWNDPVIKDPVLLPEQCWGLRKGKIYTCLDDLNLPCKHTIINDQFYPSICVPLLAQNNIHGMLYLQIKDSSSMSKEQLIELADENDFLIENIGGHISLAIANMELQDALRIRSIRDSLTGLYNRSYLDESLNRDIERAKRKKISIALVMLDLDHFKKINDTFGHEAGDLVLVELGKLLKLHTRKSDIACRYGGEEFLIILYDATQTEAFKRCEGIRKEISEMNIYLGEKLIGPVSASFGIAMYPKDSQEWDRLISAADKALYASKNMGRNKVTLYQDLQDKE